MDAVAKSKPDQALDGDSVRLTAPLSNRVFRWIWLATVITNIGGWVHDVAAGWLMTSLSPSPFMVSLVQAATSLPVFLLSIPAGALADVLDRRRLLLFAQIWMMAAALALGILTAQGWTTAGMLLLLTFALESGTAIEGPAWQAIVPELVSRNQVRSAVTLNGLGINVARALGPAIGGAIVAAAGPATAFFVNTVSFLGVAGVLLWWRRPHEKSVLPAERFLGAVKAGARYVRYAPAVQAVLIRTGAFMIGASAIWALLPSLARVRLGLGPTGYGTLLGCLGSGALVGAVLLGRIRQRSSTDALVMGATLVFAIAITITAEVPNFFAVCGAMMGAGVGWVLVVANLNASAQAAAPDWARARVLSIYLVVFFGGMAGGSALWGAVAVNTSISTALWCAAAVILVTLALAARFRLAVVEGKDLSPARHWLDPVLEWEPALQDGPVLVTVQYEIAADRVAAFVAAVHKLRHERMRDGAFQWGVFRDLARPERFIETFLVESWAEHLRQHDRVTRADQDFEECVKTFHVGKDPPIVTHLIYSHPSEFETPKED